jgi:hypothetical protein
MPAWSGDGSRIYFLRAPVTTVTDPHELWSVRPDGGELQKHGTIGGFRAIDTFFDVSRQNEIVWGAYRPGRRELWAATIRN